MAFGERFLYGCCFFSVSCLFSFFYVLLGPPTDLVSIVNRAVLVLLRRGLSLVFGTGFLSFSLHLIFRVISLEGETFPMVNLMIPQAGAGSSGSGPFDLNVPPTPILGVKSSSLPQETYEKLLSLPPLTQIEQREVEEIFPNPKKDHEGDPRHHYSGYKPQ